MESVLLLTKQQSKPNGISLILLSRTVGTHVLSKEDPVLLHVLRKMPISLLHVQDVSVTLLIVENNTVLSNV